MFKEGVLEEFIKNNIKVKNCNIVKAIGYQEIDDYFENKITLSDLKKNNFEHQEIFQTSIYVV